VLRALVELIVLGLSTQAHANLTLQYRADFGQWAAWGRHR